MSKFRNRSQSENVIIWRGCPNSYKKGRCCIFQVIYLFIYTFRFRDPPYGIYIAPNADDLTEVIAMIIGPANTPYEGGFFIFRVVFPPYYPHHPPTMNLISTGAKTVRFGPNLYMDGKVS